MEGSSASQGIACLRRSSGSDDAELFVNFGRIARVRGDRRLGLNGCQQAWIARPPDPRPRA